MSKEGSAMKRLVRFPGLLVTAFVTMSFAVLVPSALASAASAPTSPQGVHARSIAGFAFVSWSRPSSGAPIKSYVVTSHPLGQTCVSKTTTCAVTHLKPDASYAFTVTARTAEGTSISSPLSNRVRIPTAGKNYLSAVDTLNEAVATEFVAIENASPSAPLTKQLKALSGYYSTFTFTLKADEWPADARSDIASVISDASDVSNDTVNVYEANASTVPAVAATLQGDDNAETEADARVRTDLGLSQVIIAPITATPTPTSIGATVTLHDFRDDELSVTVTQVVDPATAASGSGLPDAGTRFIAVDMNLSDVTGGAITGDANYSTTVSGSDGKTYTADIGSVEGCSNFSIGIFQMSGAGESLPGCVVFELPTTVSVQTVNFSLAPGYLDSGVWNN
jgi:hypothetical protein